MDKNKRPIQIFWTTWNIVEALILLAGGVFCIIGRQEEELQKWISVLIGGFVVLDGILRVVLYFAGIKANGDAPALVGGFEITAGLVIAFQYEHFIEMVIMFLYILLIVMGALILIMAIMRIAKHTSTIFMPILTIIVGAIILGLGAAICVIKLTGGEDSNQLVLVIIGCILIVAGGALLVSAAIQGIKGAKDSPKKEKKAKVKDYIEAEPAKPTDVVEVTQAPAEIENKDK